MNGSLRNSSSVLGGTLNEPDCIPCDEPPPPSDPDDTGDNSPGDPIGGQGGTGTGPSGGSGGGGGPGGSGGTYQISLPGYSPVAGVIIQVGGQCSEGNHATLAACMAGNDGSNKYWDYDLNVVMTNLDDLVALPCCGVDPTVIVQPIPPTPCDTLEKILSYPESNAEMHNIRNSYNNPNITGEYTSGIFF